MPDSIAILYGIVFIFKITYKLNKRIVRPIVIMNEYKISKKKKVFEKKSVQKEFLVIFPNLS